MLRTKYWFPYMNSLVDHTVEQCFECKVPNTRIKEEPIKPSVISSKPWETVSADFSGPCPGGQYNLVVIDKRTRYPEVEPTCTTASKTTKVVPNRLETDNGQPINSKDFEKFEERIHTSSRNTSTSKSQWTGWEIHETFKQNRTDCLPQKKDKLKRNTRNAYGLSWYTTCIYRCINLSSDEWQKNTCKTWLYTTIKKKPNQQDQLINRCDDQYKAKWATESQLKKKV